MQSIENFCQPQTEWAEIKAIQTMAKETRGAIERDEWMSVIARTIITEVIAIVFLATNIGHTLVGAVTLLFSDDQSKVGEYLLNGLKAEGYLLAVACSFPILSIMSVTGSTEMLPEPRREATSRQPTTEQAQAPMGGHVLGGRSEADRLQQRIHQLEEENLNLQGVIGALQEEGEADPRNMEELVARLSLVEAARNSDQQMAGEMFDRNCQLTQTVARQAEQIRALEEKLARKPEPVADPTVNEAEYVRYLRIANLDQNKKVTLTIDELKKLCNKQ